MASFAVGLLGAAVLVDDAGLEEAAAHGEEFARGTRIPLLVSFPGLLEPIRMIKTPEEVALIRRAIAITEASIAATFGQLAAGI